jgi:hypothetical protein
MDSGGIAVGAAVVVVLVLLALAALPALRFKRDEH